MAKFTDLKLFDNYPAANKPPEDGTTTVIKCHFTFFTGIANYST